MTGKAENPSNLLGRSRAGVAVTSPGSESMLNFVTTSFHSNNPGTTYMNCVGFGQPFLTYNIPVSKKFLNKHGLALGKLYHYNDRNRMPILLDALAQYQGREDLRITPGGFTLNAGRVIQWLLHQPKSVVFLGARCLDKEGAILYEACKKTDLCYCTYQMNAGSTSIFVVLHHNKRYCQLVFLDNGPVFNKVSFIDIPLVTKILERANIFYATDQGMSALGEVIHKVAYYCSSRFKVFCLFLGCHNLVRANKTLLLKVLKYTDMVFMTPACMKSILTVYNIPQSCKSCSTFKGRAVLVSSWVKEHSTKNCTVIVTDGLYRAFVCSQMPSTMTEFCSNYVKTDAVVDTFGCDSAFFGGFMAMLLQGYSTEMGIECGFYVAKLIATKIGVHFQKEDITAYRDWLATAVPAQSRILIDLPFTVFQSPWKVPNVFPRQI